MKVNAYPAKYFRNLRGTQAYLKPWSTLSNMNICETSWPIVIKFHLEHHRGWGLSVIGFGPDRNVKVDL